jgi:hypothetical protein
MKTTRRGFLRVLGVGAVSCLAGGVLKKIAVLAHGKLDDARVGVSGWVYGEHRPGREQHDDVAWELLSSGGDRGGASDVRG